MSDGLWPRMSHISLSFGLIDREMDALSDTEYRALICLVRYAAASQCWTYSEPGDGSLPNDDHALAKVCRVSERKWRVIWPAIEQYFEVKGKRLHLRMPWINFSVTSFRSTPSARVEKLVKARDGHRCTYCGTTDGPFELDHILPISRGGTNDAHNLCLACQSCNRSKSDKTLREWIRS